MQDGKFSISKDQVKCYGSLKEGGTLLACENQGKFHGEGSLRAEPEKRKLIKPGHAESGMESKWKMHYEKVKCNFKHLMYYHPLLFLDHLFQ